MPHETKCIKCGSIITIEEQQKRYDELIAQGITPMLVPMCAKCRSGK